MDQSTFTSGRDDLDFDQIFDLEESSDNVKDKNPPPIVAPTVKDKDLRSGSFLSASNRKSINNLMRGCHVLALRILDKTELLTKAMSHDDMTQIYLAFKSSKCSQISVRKHKSTPFLYSVQATLNGIRVHFSFNARHTLSALGSKLTTIYSWDAVYNALCYLIYGFSANDQAITKFVHIDDTDMLKDSIDRMQRVFGGENPGEYWAHHPVEVLSTAFGHHGVFSHHGIPGEVYIHNILDGYSKYEAEEVEYCDFVQPELFANSLDESRLYDLFAFLLIGQDVIALDTETSSLDPLSAEIVSVGLSFDTRIGFYISTNHRKMKKRKIVVGERGLIQESAVKYNDMGQRNLVRLYEGWSVRWREMLKVTPPRNEHNVDWQYFSSMFAKYLSTKKLIYQNGKFDYKMLAVHLRARCDIPTYFDTMLAHYLCRPSKGKISRHNLQFIATTELGVPAWKGDITKCQHEHKDLVASYNTRDLCYTMGSSLTMYPSIRDSKLFWNVEKPFLRVLAEAEAIGICIDKDALLTFESTLKKKMSEIEQYFVTMSEDSGFKLSSTVHLSKLIFGKMKVEPIRKCRSCTLTHLTGAENCPSCGAESPIKRMTPAGKPSLDKMSLEDLADAGIEVAQKVVEYRIAAKLVTSYTNLHEKVSVHDGHLHPNFNQAITSTGRLSCSNPNFQQLPKGKLGKAIRNAIVPPPGYCILGADYSGQEIRIMAVCSGDEKLIKAYNPCYYCEHNKSSDQSCQFGKCAKEDHSFEDSACNILDVHSYITKQVYADIIDVPISEIKEHPVWDAYRRKCKAVTFALAYGGSAYGIADKNGMTIDEAEKLVEDYFKTFPGIKAYIDRCQRFVDKYGYIVDLFDRRRDFQFAGHAIKERFEQHYRRVLNPITNMGEPLYEYRKEISGDKRAGTNFPIQAVAATMTKIGANELAAALKELGVDAKIVGFVHDELVLIIKKDKEVIENVINLVNECMVRRLNLPFYSVPNTELGWKTWPPYVDMAVDINIGDSYGTIGNVEKYLGTLN